MDIVETLSPEEKRAYDLIISEDGMLQSELWKELDVSSRKGSSLATALAESGLIEREETLSNGRKTYWLKPTDNQSESTDSPGIGSGPAQTDAVDQDQGAKDEFDSREEWALSLILERNGIYQSELWKELDVSSRTGSRIATKLEENGRIRRKETTYNGQRTYLLLPPKTDLDFSLLMSGDQIAPLVGEEEGFDPIESNQFTQWILRLAQE